MPNRLSSGKPGRKPFLSGGGIQVIGVLWASIQGQERLREQAYYTTAGGPNPNPIRVEQAASFWTFAYRCLMVVLASGIFVRLGRLLKNPEDLPVGRVAARSEAKGSIVKQVVIISFGLCVVVILVGCSDGGPRHDFKVLRVIDGDTFVVHYDGEPTSVRIAEMDAPEPREPGGPEAKAALIELIGGRTVRLEFPGPRKRDHFGRLLARAYVNGLDVGARMVELGHAR